MAATRDCSGCRLRRTRAKTSSPNPKKSFRLPTLWGSRNRQRRFPVGNSALEFRGMRGSGTATWVGIVLGVATTAAYLIGAGRSFGYDAAATFASYIATPNMIDAFAVHSVLPSIPLKSIASNDHVFLSLISHVIYSLTGSRSEENVVVGRDAFQRDAGQHRMH